ncbi:DMT family transporter [Hoeflea poritis]|uniref:DMT family transporter n=1 Tax=Hoeflea poritis TaxID=2993659 RepID=A0ABT4VJH9_9HYPH|nr:DMT family transporter [Hoeflea poritis]MDA4844851.1 DMT family transporter [Hoeflea poritis]
MTDPRKETRAVLTGIVTILLTVFAMALTDAFVKFSSADMTLWQIYVCRSAIALPLLLLLGRGGVLPKAIGWVALRSLALVAMYLAIYAAIPLLDLSVIAASLYTGPLFIVLLSAVFLHERVAPQQWLAVALGFVGVLFVVRPNGADFTALSLIPIIAALLYALVAVLTRAKCADETPASLAAGLNVGLIAFGGAASLWFWVSPSDHAETYPFLFGTWSSFGAGTIGILCVMAVLIVGVSIGLARAYQSPRPQIIATFDYAYLIFAAFWGFVFFREVPDVWTVAGIALIIAAGVLVLVRRPDAQASRLDKLPDTGT